MIQKYDVGVGMIMWSRFALVTNVLLQVGIFDIYSRRWLATCLLTASHIAQHLFYQSLIVYLYVFAVVSLL